MTSGEAEVGYTVRIFLEVSDVIGLNALDASLNFDPNYLELVNVSLEPSISDWLFQSFSPTPGVLNIATTTATEYSEAAHS